MTQIMTCCSSMISFMHIAMIQLIDVCTFLLVQVYRSLTGRI